MKTLFKLAFIVAATTVVAKALLMQAESRRRSLPTLRPVRDAEPQRPEPLREEDLNVAQNAPF